MELLANLLRFSLVLHPEFDLLTLAPEVPWLTCFSTLESACVVLLIRRLECVRVNYIHALCVVP